MQEIVAQKIVAVVGASPKEDRPSFEAVKMLLEYGHRAIPVSPTAATVSGVAGCRSLAEIPEKLDTVAVYVGAARQDAVLAEVLAAKPRRVIFPPGAENPAAYARLRAAGIEPVEGCTMVMLRTGRF